MAPPRSRSSANADGPRAARRRISARAPGAAGRRSWGAEDGLSSSEVVQRQTSVSRRRAWHSAIGASHVRHPGHRTRALRRPRDRLAERIATGLTADHSDQVPAALLRSGNRTSADERKRASAAPTCEWPFKFGVLARARIANEIEGSSRSSPIVSTRDSSAAHHRTARHRARRRGDARPESECTVEELIRTMQRIRHVGSVGEAAHAVPGAPIHDVRLSAVSSQLSPRAVNRGYCCRFEGLRR